MRLRRRKWWKCGGPAADRMIGGRVKIATAIAIRIVPGIVPKRARRLPPPQPRLLTAPGASGMGADGATATMTSVSPAPMRRSKPLQQRTARRLANHARTRAVRRASVFRARTGIRTGTKANLAVGARRADEKKADVATNAPRAGRRTGSSQPARRRASANARSTPIRRLPNWLLSKNSSPPARISARLASVLEWVLLGAPACR